MIPTWVRWLPSANLGRWPNNNSIKYNKYSGGLPFLVLARKLKHKGLMLPTTN